MKIFDKYIFLQRFIFSKTYIFSRNILREKKNPQFYATRIYSIPSGILAFDIYKICKKLLLNEVQSNSHFLFFLILCLAIFTITDHFILKNKDYDTLVNEIKVMSKRENKRWEIISWSYISIITIMALVLTLY